MISLRPAAIDYGALEQRVAEALGDIERGLHAQVLARLDIDVPAIRVWGDEYRRIGAGAGAAVVAISAGWAQRYTRRGKSVARFD
jgi:hypothetical protein